MLHKLQVLAFTWALGVFSFCNAAAITHHDEPLKPGKPIGLHDLLTTGENVVNSAGQLNITSIQTGTSGVIHFLKVYYYPSDDGTNCTGTPLGSASVVDNVNGFSFNLNDTVSLNTNAAYILATNHGITPSNISCLELYVDGSNDTSNAVNCQSFPDEVCTGGSCLSGLTKTVGWNTNNHNFPCRTRSAYVVKINGNSNNLFQCGINETTGLLSCGAGVTIDSLFAGPNAIAINNGYAYITGFQLVVGSPNAIYKCDVSPSNGALSSCALTFSTGTSTSIYGIALNYKYAYITLADSSVAKCDVSATTGTISNCQPAASGPQFATSTGIVISNGYAYVVNTPSSGTGTVIPCQVDGTNGDLNCSTATGNGFASPQGISINNAWAYITNVQGNNISLCSAATPGSLTNTCTTPTSVTSPAGIAINNAFAYVTSSITAGVVNIYSINFLSGLLTFVATQGSVGNTPSPITIY